AEARQRRAHAETRVHILELGVRVGTALARLCPPYAPRRSGLMLTILFDGIAYGMVLFVLAVGLSVTLGLMNFINLAHGAFAMAGGYVAVLLVNLAGVPFLAALP